MDTDELAVSFLQNFIDVPESELVEMAITQCLSDLLESIVIETRELIYEEKNRTIH
jgi:hypothetical protein